MMDIERGENAEGKKKKKQNGLDNDIFTPRIFALDHAVPFESLAAEEW
jgi:hypothetical protein